VRRECRGPEILLDPMRKLRINGHHVFVLAVDRAFLHHQDFAIALDDLRLDFRRPFRASDRASLFLPSKDASRASLTQPGH